MNRIRIDFELEDEHEHWDIEFEPGHITIMSERRIIACYWGEVKESKKVLEAALEELLEKIKRTVAACLMASELGK